MIDRFGDDQDVLECDSCRADFQRLNDAGKLVFEDWTLIVVKSPENNERPAQ